MTQSVKDALADAETLRLFAEREEDHSDGQVWMAGYYGTYVAERMARTKVEFTAVKAARAAFRAVPELRA